MDGLRNDHIKRNKLGRDKYHDILICGVLKNDTKEFIYKTETDSQTHRTNL